jgi:hypothetical protein
MRSHLVLIQLALLGAFLLPTRLRAQATIARSDSARPETVERLLQVADVERLYKQSVDATLAAQLKASPQLAPYEDVLRSFMAKYADYASLKPEYVRIYRETFSEAELQETIRFYQSPFGKMLMGKMPALMARTSELTAQRMHAHLPELIAELQARANQSSTPK